MTSNMYAVAAAALAVIVASTAEARRRPQALPQDPPVQSVSTEWPQWAFPNQTEGASPARETGARRRSGRRGHEGAVAVARHHGLGPRPGAWCGWYMRTRHGGGPEMNVAWNWRRYGNPGSPQVGAIVVWHHHVGEIVGQASNGQCIVLSGNDSHRVRQRPRSIAGAVVRI